MLLADDPRFRAAMQLIDNAEYAEAIHQLDILRDQLSAEERVVALYWKVRCLTTLGKMVQARTCLEEALTQVGVSSPLRIVLQLHSAYLLHAEQGPDKAVLEMQSLLNRYATEIKTPDFSWVYVQTKQDLGFCLLFAALYSEAVKELEEALSLQDDPLPRYYIHFGLGDAYYQLGDLDKARDHFERALGKAQSAPKAGISAYYLGRIGYELALVAYKQRRFDDAQRHLEFASAVPFQDPELLGVIKRLKALVDQAETS